MVVFGATSADDITHVDMVCDLTLTVLDTLSFFPAGKNDASFWDTFTSRDYFLGLKSLQNPTNGFECSSASHIQFTETQDINGFFQLSTIQPGALAPAPWLFWGKKTVANPHGLERATDGACSDAAHTTQADCETASATWSTTDVSVPMWDGQENNAHFLHGATLQEIFASASSTNMIESGGIYPECDAGSFYDKAKVECKLCPAGEYTAEKATGVYQCEVCEAGSYAEGEGNIKCTPCAAGTVAPTHGHAQCDACPKGFEATTEG